MHFCQIFGLSELLTDEKLALKQGITLSKSLTERESSHQIFLPDMIFFGQCFCPDFSSEILLCVCLHRLYRQERRETHLNLALMVHGLGRVHILRNQFWTHPHPTPPHHDHMHNQNNQRFFQ